MKKLVLIDANALIHRAFHALPSLKAPDGKVVNAVYGFASIALKALKDIDPDYVAAAFDLAAPTFRHEAYKEYKSTRVKAPQDLYDQIPAVKELLTLLGIPVFEKEGYEADDLIGALAKKFAKEKGVKVIIVTGDLDTLQLIEGDKVVVYTLKKGITDTTEYDDSAVMKRYGLTPEQMPDLKGLKGDPSDNIPGVPGIGEKTAVALLKTFGTLENVYAELKKTVAKGDIKKPVEVKEMKISPSVAKKLLENEEQAYFSKELGSIVTDIPVSATLKSIEWKKQADKNRLNRFFKDLGFFSLLKRLPQALQESDMEDAPSARKQQVRPLALGPASVNALVQAALKECALYLWSGNDGSVLLHAGDATYQCEGEDAFKTHASDLKKVFENSDIALIGHETKRIYKQLRHAGITPHGIAFDTALAAWLLNSDRKDYSFKKIFFSECGRELGDDPSQYGPALEELYVMLSKRYDAELLNVLENFELPLIPVLVEMESNGVRINVRALKALSKSVARELRALEKKIYRFAGDEFNINSPQQLSHILFEKLELKAKVRKTGGGARSTAAAELEKMRDEHPIIDLILEYREFQKAKTTYIDPFPNYVDSNDRIHTDYVQTGTATGRLSSQHPNVQNIPTHGETGHAFRRVFIADPGYTFVSFDYNQIELRLAAHISGDETMIRAFKEGEDIHLRTASEIFDEAPDRVTSHMRRQAKALNFGVLYGMGPLGFARAAGVSRERAKEFIEKYFLEFEKIAEYIERTKEEARETGTVKTLFGRRRAIPEIVSHMPDLQRQAERMAVNMPIQGTAADIMKRAMIRVHDAVKGDESVRVLLQVHDELLCEIKDERCAEYIKVIKEIMEGVADFSVPLTVEVKTGKNWDELAVYE